MSRTPNTNMDRLLDLLADRAVGALDPKDAIELDRLLRDHPDFEADAMDAAAAIAAMSLCPPADEPMPESLRTRLLRDAEAFASERDKPIGRVNIREQVGSSARGAWFPWLLAAASIAIAVGAWMSRPATPPSPTLADQLARFTTAQPPADLLRIAWAGQPDPLVTEQLSGEVYWSQSEQKGFMVFSGLRENDPTREQYQLWIFDDAREHPVDGGVFDIDADGRVIVPIDAKLPVRDPSLFAVTVEKPGGVVVSSKERIAAVAPIEKS